MEYIKYYKVLAWQLEVLGGLPPSQKKNFQAILQCSIMSFVMTFLLALGGVPKF